MKIKAKKGYMAVYGETFPVKIGQFLVGGKKEVKAVAFAPFIFFKNESFEVPWVVNHELIHFRQTYELFFIGAFILHIFEGTYARLVLKMSAFDAYKYYSLEQEAYLNHNNLSYLETRKVWSIFKYIKNKKDFVCNKDTGEVQIL